MEAMFKARSMQLTENNMLSEIICIDEEDIMLVDLVDAVVEDFIVVVVQEIF